MSNNDLVNTVELGHAIKRERESRGLSMDGVERETGVSKSTISRLEAGIGKPDAGTIARLSKWLNAPAARFMKNDEGSVTYYPNESTPAVVQAFLDADKNLTPETAVALGELFRVAYKSLSKSSK